jgi:AFG3 family protein
MFPKRFLLFPLHHQPKQQQQHRLFILPYSLFSTTTTITTTPSALNLFNRILRLTANNSNGKDTVPRAFGGFAGRTQNNNELIRRGANNNRSSSSTNTNTKPPNTNTTSSTNTTTNKSRSQQQQSNNNNSNNKPPQPDPNRISQYVMIGIGLAGAIMWASYARNAFGPGTGNEIDWQTFRTHFLSTGEVERLVVVNKQICRVYLRNRTTNKTIEDHQQHQHHQQQPFTPDPSTSIPSSSSFSNKQHHPSTTTTPPQHQQQHQQQFYFTIGSLDNFERKLEDAQRDLGIQSSDFVPVQYVNEFSWFVEIIKYSPTVVMFGIWMYLMFMMRGGAGGPAGGGMNQIFKISKSPARMFGGKDGAKVNTKFADVAGCEEAKAEIAEFVDFLKNPKRFTDVGAKIPRGALLWGPPGTGKTLLAKAVAGEASVPFFSISGSDFIEMFVGVGPSRVRDLFNEARKNAPCIVFIDEIDAVARARGKGAFGGNDERENTLNQLLVELDGFNTKEGVVVLAGTNRLDILDPAILRPGRFDRQIKVDLPDVRGRKEIFKVHMKNVKIQGGAAEVENTAQRLAALTPGFSGAQISNVINEAAILAARDASEYVTPTHFDRAVDRVIGGLERKNAIMTPQERKTVAYHEAGHALAGWFLEHADPLLKVTIVPRISGALGYAQYLPKEVSLHTRLQLEDRMCMALGGRAAEEITFGTVTTGAQDDLNKVTQMAYAMVTLFGMSDKIGQLSYPRDANDFGVKPYSNATAEMIDMEVRKIVDGAFARVRNLLLEHKKDLEAIALRLLERETINQHDITELVGERQWKMPSTFAEFVAAGTSSTVSSKNSGKNSNNNKEENDIHNTPVVEPAL